MCADSQSCDEDKDEEKKEDKISKLSDTLIHHILSFCCSMKLAVQTSILSKRWRYIWTSLPTLYLKSHEFKERQWYSSVSNEIIVSDLFVEFVDSALNLRDHKSDIEKFHLNCGCSDHLNRWITAALNRNVVELSVVIRGGFDFVESEEDTVKHHLPCNLLFNCGTLAKLKLKVDIEIRKETEDHEVIFCKDYYSKITFPKSMDLHCLRVLRLKSLDIDNANNLFLQSNCPPLLEHLSINGCKVSIGNCCDVEWFHIESLTLKHFELKNCIMPKKIKLIVPNLQTFICKDYTWREYSMENISSLVCAHIEMLDFSSQGYGEHYLKLPVHEKELCATQVMDFLKALDTVNELQLSPGILEIISGIPDLLDSPPAVQLGSVRCLKLETYYVRTCFQAIPYLMKILPSIESLTMEIPNEHMTPNYWRWHDPTEDWVVTFPFPCMLFQLKSVKIVGLGGFDNEFNLVEFLLKNASNLKDVVLYISYGNNWEHFEKIEKFCSKLRACPRSSSNISVFVLSMLQ